MGQRSIDWSKCLREKAEIPCYTKRGQEMSLHFAGELIDVIRSEIGRARRRRLPVNVKMLEVLGQLVSGRYIDQNGVESVVPDRSRVRACQLARRLRRMVDTGEARI